MTQDHDESAVGVLAINTDDFAEYEKLQEQLDDARDGADNYDVEFLNAYKASQPEAYQALQDLLNSNESSDDLENALDELDEFIGQMEVAMGTHEMLSGTREGVLRKAERPAVEKVNAKNREVVLANIIPVVQENLTAIYDKLQSPPDVRIATDPDILADMYQEEQSFPYLLKLLDLDEPNITIMREEAAIDLLSGFLDEYAKYVGVDEGLSAVIDGVPTDESPTEYLEPDVELAVKADAPVTPTTSAAGDEREVLPQGRDAWLAKLEASRGIGDGLASDSSVESDAVSDAADGNKYSEFEKRETQADGSVLVSLEIKDPADVIDSRVQDFTGFLSGDEYGGPDKWYAKTTDGAQYDWDGTTWKNDNGRLLVGDGYNTEFTLKRKEVVTDDAPAPEAEAPAPAPEAEAPAPAPPEAPAPAPPEAPAPEAVVESSSDTMSVLNQLAKFGFLLNFGRVNKIRKSLEAKVAGVKGLEKPLIDIVKLDVRNGVAYLKVQYTNATHGNAVTREFVAASPNAAKFDTSIGKEVKYEKKYTVNESAENQEAVKALFKNQIFGEAKGDGTEAEAVALRQKRAKGLIKQVGVVAVDLQRLLEDRRNKASAGKDGAVADLDKKLKAGYDELEAVLAVLKTDENKDLYEEGSLDKIESALAAGRVEITPKVA